MSSVYGIHVLSCILSKGMSDILYHQLHRGSYMRAHVLLNLLNKLEKKIKRKACRAFIFFLQQV